MDKRKRNAIREAQTAVKNAHELVIFLGKDDSVQTKKIALGAQSLFSMLLQEAELRLYKEEIDASVIMPNGRISGVAPADASIRRAGPS